LIKVFIAQHPTEAHLVAGLLESGGIGAEVQGEALFSARGEVPITPSTLPSVWVLDDSQVDEALELIRRPRPDAAAATAAGPSWLCGGCGEAIEAQFTTCWKCGAERESSDGAQ
jgi:hypothetical protein